MHTHQVGPARARGPAVDFLAVDFLAVDRPVADSGQLAARPHYGLVDSGASWTPCCRYFRACCSALSAIYM